MPKDHSHLLKFANFGSQTYQAPEKHDHETHSEMSAQIFFRIWAKCVGTISSKNAFITKDS